MKKKLLVLAISAAVSHAAFAQAEVGKKSAADSTANTTKVVTVGAPLAPPPIPSITPTPALDVPHLKMEKLADNPLVNPFSGNLVSDEEMQRELERKRRQTQMAEELLKQSNVANELHASTMRKNVEIAQSVTALQKEHNAQIDLRSVLETREAERLRITANYEAELKRQAEEKRKAAAEEKERKRQLAEAEKNKLSPTALAEKRRAEAAAIKAAAQLKESQAQAIAQQRPQELPSLVSVMEVSGKKTAVVKAGGQTFKVADGEQTAYGKVRVLNNRAVTFDGKNVEISGVGGITRFVRSDPAPVDPAAMQGGQMVGGPMGGSPMMGGMVAPSTVSQGSPIELSGAPKPAGVSEAPAPSSVTALREKSAPTLPKLQLPPPTPNFKR